MLLHLEVTVAFTIVRAMLACLQGMGQCPAQQAGVFQKLTRSRLTKLNMAQIMMLIASKMGNHAEGVLRKLGGPSAADAGVMFPVIEDACWPG